MLRRRRILAAAPLVACVLALACGRRAAPTEVVVYAAASLRDALQDVAHDFESTSDTKVVFNFGSSGDLSRQIALGGRADVFLSAGEAEMDRVEKAGLVVPGTRRELLSNHLAVIEPAGETAASAFAAPFSPGHLASPRLRRLSIADPEAVPAGRYARAWLEERGVWESVRERVLPGVDVRAALAAVESGAAEAGIVYRTDAAISKRVRVVHVVPAGEGPRITYATALLASAGPRARELFARLGSPAAAVIFERHGFVPLSASASLER